LVAGKSSPRRNAHEKTARKARAATESFTKVRYRSELLDARERNTTFKIADFSFQIYRMRRDAPDEPIENRQSKFDNADGAALPGL
jgi:hypothetical protein